MNNLRKQVVTGMIWRLGERLLAQSMTFLVSLVLARLVGPKDYGIVSLTLVFMTFANLFVSDGFGKALIQKDDADARDFSVVFYFNLVLAFLLYMLVYWGAPLLAEFYHEPLLTATLRIIALRLPLTAVNALQHAYVSRYMLFKRFFFATLWGTLISGVVGITLAFQGYGVWALVAQYLTNTLVDTLFLWLSVRWRPLVYFSWSRLKALLTFGSHILLAGFLNTFYNNLRQLVIGKRYTAADLAYYTKGSHFPGMLTNNVNASLGSVLYPAFARLQHDSYRLKQSVRQAIQVSTFILFPILIGLFGVAEAFVLFCLGEAWLAAVPFLRIACVYFTFYPMNTILLQAILALGEGKLYLRLNVLKKAVGILLIVLSIPFGVLAIAFSEILAGIFALLVNVTFSARLFHYSMKQFVTDVFPSLLLTVLMSVFVWLAHLGLTLTSLWLTLIVEVLVGVLSYGLLTLWVRPPAWRLAKQMMREKQRKRGHDHASDI